MRRHPETRGREAPEEHLMKMKRVQRRLNKTMMQIIRQDLHINGIRLDLSKKTEFLIRLSELTYDKNHLCSIVQRITLSS